MTTEALFYNRATAWLDHFLAYSPVAATHMGDHRWDDRLSDSSAEGLEQQHQEMRAALAEFQAMETADFSQAAAIDHTLFVHILEAFLRGFEKEQDHLRQPSAYLGEVLGGVFSLIIRDFAPLPERLRSAIGRLREAPRVLREGQANLVAARVPPIWAQVTLQQAGQAAGLFTGMLPAIAAQAAPELLPELQAAGQAAVQAVEEYAAFVKDEVLPQAAGDFATGKELFDEMLREQHMVDYDADQLFETGWELFHQTRAQMEAVSREIDPDKTVHELLEEAKADHPTAEGLLDTYRQAMAAAREYVVAQEIATIPAGESLRVVETPVFQRMLIPYAAYSSPGILEEEQEGIFWVTPVDPQSSPEEQEEKLKGHYRSKLPITALHEAYPGHHLQLVWANQHEKIPRRMASFLSSLFIEGWAFYCEELMEQLGFIAAPIQRLARLSDQLWRAARIILDASLHTRGMSVDEAVAFLVEECQLEPTNALAEVTRYTQTPTQPQTYLMGKLAIVELVAEYRQAHPEAGLREVHDAILACGSLPPRLMRRQLGLAAR